MEAGRLDGRYRFERRVEVADGNGNFDGGWQTQFTVAGNRKFLRPRNGSEAVMAARLTGRPLLILTIRNSTQATEITSDWRAVDARTGEVFNIRENPQLSDSRMYLEMLCESGVAV